MTKDCACKGSPRSCNARYTCAGEGPGHDYCSTCELLCNSKPDAAYQYRYDDSTKWCKCAFGHANIGTDNTCNANCSRGIAPAWGDYCTRCEEADCGRGFRDALQDSIYSYSTPTGGTCACRGGSSCKLPNLCKQITSSILERFCMLCKGVCDQRTATSTPTLFPIWSSTSVTSSTDYGATTTTSDDSSFTSHRCACASRFGCKIPNSCVGFTSTPGGRCYRCLGERCL